MNIKVIRGTKSFEKIHKNDLSSYKKEKDIYDEYTKEQNDYGIKLFSSIMGNSLFHVILSGYSYGVPIKMLKKYGEQLFECYLNAWDGTVYFDIEKAYEIAIIFDLSKENVMKFAELQKKYKFKDKFLDLLLRYFDKQAEVSTDKLFGKKALSPLVEVIELAEHDKQKAILRLKIYLDRQWLNMQKEGLIMNKQHLKEETFRGYWCIEAAALVKMLNLNDDIIKDHIYYPYELAHYQVQ